MLTTGDQGRDKSNNFISEYLRGYSSTTNEVRIFEYSNATNEVRIFGYSNATNEVRIFEYSNATNEM